MTIPTPIKSAARSTLLGALTLAALGATAAFAQEAAPAAPAAVDAAAAAAPAMTVDKGDTTWMLVSTVLVLLMTIPGLALFYGGLVRAKNMLSVLMQVFMICAVVMIVWVTYGYSPGLHRWRLAQQLRRRLLQDVPGRRRHRRRSPKPSPRASPFPNWSSSVFQMTFACITPALIVGAFAERIKFSALILFVVLWVTFVYFPMAHMVWFWGGPSAYDGPTGLIFGFGAIDFAGGTVVHINAGIAGLVGALMIGKRIGYKKELMAPHSMTLTMVGASLLWVGWFGFNAGSNLEANAYAALAMINTFVATAAAAVAWAVA